MKWRALVKLSSYVVVVSLLGERPFVLITGISAAGKSTVAEMLARRFDLAVHVKGDVYRRMVVAGRAEMTSSPSEEAWRQLRLRYRLGATTADAYYAAGFAVILQDVVIGSVLSEYIGAIRTRPLYVVVLAPSPEVVMRREAGREKVAYRGEPNGVEALDLALRRETPRVGLWIDSSRQTPEETVEVILREAPDAARVS